MTGNLHEFANRGTRMVRDTDIMAEGENSWMFDDELNIGGEVNGEDILAREGNIASMGSYNENGSDSDSCEDGSESESDFVLSDHFEEDEDVIEAWKELRSNEMKDKMVVEDEDQHNEKEKYPLDDCDSGHSSVSKATFFATNCNLKDMEWQVGLKFKDGKECKDAVASWAIVNGWNIKWTKSSKMRLQAECVKGCNWRLYASKVNTEPTFMIRSLGSDHNCIRVKRNRQANRVWISKQLVSILKRDPNATTELMIKEMEERFDVIITHQMCYRAKKIALEEIRGSFNDEYKMLRSYVLELMKSDPEGKFVLHTDTDSKGNSIFKRIFIGFSILKKGFLYGYRHILCFDGCFLKTVFGGVLLAAVGRDCNFKMYPIAWAVVEKENTETWTWFCQLIFEQFGITDGLGWSFMPDKQKGLINAIQKLASNAEHRHCARHVYANFKKKWNGPKYEELFWNCVKASTPTQFKIYLENLKAESVQAWEDFCERNPKSFCKSLFSSYTKTDMLENNICESFNSFILRARDKPILQMLETIRKLVMIKIHVVSKALQKSNDEICPEVRKKIYEIDRFTKFCDIRPSYKGKYEVHLFKCAYKVDLGAKTCTCGDWELTGLPCCHALACIHYARDDIVSYVDPFFLKSYATALYDHGLEPLAGQQEWPFDNMPPVLPPKIHRLPGRPKKQRKGGVDEVRKHNSKKVTRHEIKMTCKNYGGIGHNRKGCKELPGNQGHQPLQDQIHESTPSNTSSASAKAKRKRSDTIAPSMNIGANRSDASKKASKNDRRKAAQGFAMPKESTSKAKRKRSDTIAPSMNTGANKSDASKRASKNDRRKVAQGFRLLQSESGNVFKKHPGSSRVHYVYGSEATAEAVRNITAQTRSQTHMSSHVDDGRNQVVDPTCSS